VYAQLVGKYSFGPERHVTSTGWTGLNWLVEIQHATSLPYEEAVRLPKELAVKQSGHKYVVERDEHGEANRPPYGLDNFVLRRED
jgi:hypothetical protein